MTDIHTDTIQHQDPIWGSPGFTSKVADAFAVIEKHNIRVEEILVHPSVVHRFVFSMSGNMDVDETFKTVGRVWGAEVTVDPAAPSGGFLLKSEGDTHRVWVEGPIAPPRHIDNTPAVFCKHPVLARKVVELLDLSGQWGGTENLRLELNARVYSGIRKFGRDLLDIETSASALKTGLQGTIFGVKMMVSRQAHPTRIILRDDSRVYGILETDPLADTTLMEQTNMVLDGRKVEPYVDRIMAGVTRGIDEAWAEVSYDFSDDFIEATKKLVMIGVVDRIRVKYRL